MSRSITCRLCLNVCERHTNIYDENGAQNKDVYDIAIKYFPPRFLTSVNGTQRTVMCSKCTGQIAIFNFFYNSIIWAQQNLLDGYKEYKETTPREMIHLQNETIVGAVVATAHDEQPRSNVNVDLGKFVDYGKVSRNSQISEKLDNHKQDFGKTYDAVENKQDFNELSKIHSNLAVAEKCSENAASLNVADRLESGSSSKSNSIKTKQSVPDYNAASTSSFSATQSIIEEEFLLSDDFTDLWSAAMREDEKESEDCARNIFSPTVEQSETHSNSPTADEATKIAEYELDSDSSSDIEFIELPNESNSLEFKSYKKLRLKDSYKTSKSSSSQSMIMKDDLSNDSIQTTFSSSFNEDTTESIEYEEPVGVFEGGEFSNTPTTSHQSEVANHNENSKNKKCYEIGYNDALIAEWRKSFKCSLCNREFEKYQMLRLHFVQKHPGQQFYLECCNRKLYSMLYIAHHAELHVNSRVLKCDLCHINLPKYSDLRKHNLIVHAELASRTERKSLERKIIDADSMAQRKNSKYIMCEFCLKIFSSATKLEWHMIHVHHNLHKCNTCGKRFVSLTLLNQHIPVHTGMGLYKCSVCSKTFILNTSLKAHQNMAHSQLETKKYAGENALQ